MVNVYGQTSKQDDCLVQHVFGGRLFMVSVNHKINLLFYHGLEQNVIFTSISNNFFYFFLLSLWKSNLQDLIWL